MPAFRPLKAIGWVAPIFWVSSFIRGDLQGAFFVWLGWMIAWGLDERLNVIEAKLDTRQSFLCPHPTPEPSRN